jgi:hypothetical protein
MRSCPRNAPPWPLVSSSTFSISASICGYRFELAELIDAGDRIVGVRVYSGTYRKTGKFMTARVAHVWRLKEGKIVQFEQFTDTLLVAQAMN